MQTSFFYCNNITYITLFINVYIYIAVTSEVDSSLVDISKLDKNDQTQFEFSLEHSELELPLIKNDESSFKKDASVEETGEKQIYLSNIFQISNY